MWRIEMNIRCGTRGSQLALAQTQMVIDALENAHKTLQVERHEVKTLGDRKQGTPQASHSDKKDWIYDLELALLHNDIDFAVHSSKDIPYEIEAGTALLPVLARANPFDAFVGRKISGDTKRLQFADLPQGAKVGTASLRRKAFLLKMRPDIIVVEHRGNVPTRVQKMDDSPDIMGIILASAGLQRLQIPGLHYESFPSQIMLPALNQGTLAVQFRENDDAMREMLQSIVDTATYATWLAERTVAEILEGDCKSAIGIYAECVDNKLLLSASVMLPDGSEFVSAKDTSTLAEAQTLGVSVGNRLLELGAKKIIDKSRLSL
jgi:hydroxymethylbilane synthase